MSTLWVDPYLRRGNQVVKGHLKTIKGKPKKTTGDKAREWASDLGYSVTRARRAFYLGIEREWELFEESNPTWRDWHIYWERYGN